MIFVKSSNLNHFLGQRMNRIAGKINYLDGIRLHRALVAGIHKVISRQDYLNKINVFPVPDSDTGTNMAFTLSAILEGTSAQVHTDVSKMLMTVADSALDGARGNSGVIMAQFFQGLCDGASDLEKMDIRSFSTAIEFGSRYAREALEEPREGTILSVLSDFSDHLIHLIKSGIHDFATLMEMGLEKAEESLAHTTEQLEVLKKAGVVDAGAQGFVDMLNGITDFIRTGSLKEYTKHISSTYTDFTSGSAGEIQNLEYRFCTECMIKSDFIDRKPLKKELMELGNSLVFAGSRTKAKVHIHVNDPQEVFSVCEKYGTVYGQKADDMHKQQEMSHNNSNTVAIITDSGADIPENQEMDIHMIPVRYNFGNRGYIDKVSLTSKEFYHELATNPHHPQTSQPTPGDFRRQYQYLATHYRSIISIHLPAVLSGTLQSAMNAAKRVPDTTITIVDACTVSIAQGLIVMSAVEAAKEGKSHDEILQVVEDAKNRTQVYVVIPDLTWAVRGGRVKKSKKKLVDLLHITPILTTGESGEIRTATIRPGRKNLEKKLADYTVSRLERDKVYRFLIGHSDNEEGAEKVAALIRKDVQGLHSIHCLDLGGALGVHAGPGSLAVAFQEMT